MSSLQTSRPYSNGDASLFKSTGQDFLNQIKEPEGDARKANGSNMTFDPKTTMFD